MAPAPSNIVADGSGAATSVGENTGVLCPANPWLKSIPFTYATDSPDGDVVIAVGVAVLKKVNVPDCPLFKVVPELFTHSMEFPDTEFPQPNVLPAVVGTDGRLFPVVVQPYQKLFKAVPPVSVNIIV